MFTICKNGKKIPKNPTNYFPEFSERNPEFFKPIHSSSLIFLGNRFKFWKIHPKFREKFKGKLGKISRTILQVQRDLVMALLVGPEDGRLGLELFLHALCVAGQQVHTRRRRPSSRWRCSSRRATVRASEGGDARRQTASGAVSDHCCRRRQQSVVVAWYRMD